MSDRKDDSAKADEEYERLKQSRFKQQKLPAWRPVPTITSTTITFVSFGIIFIILGIIILVYSHNIIEYKKIYSDVCTNDNIYTHDDYNKNKGNLSNLIYNCQINLTIDKKMEKPIMVYYQINKFYQNHRRYVKSKNDDQLHGKDINEKVAKDDCKHAVKNKDLNINYNINGGDLDQDSVAVPCGLIAKSFFRDSFELFYKKDGLNEEEKITINEKDIAWEADKKIKFNNSKNKSKQWINMKDEHFIVWMRPSGLPNFRKLWGRIKNQDLEPGNYTVKIKHFFDVSSFDGEKYFILSTVNGFGGKNKFLGISYIVVGSISLILSIVFLIGYKIHQNKEKNN